MKTTRIVLIILAVLSFLSLTAFENDRDFDISVSEKYASAYYDESFDEVVTRLNEIYIGGTAESGSAPYTAGSLKTFFKENDIRFFAVNKTDASQVRVAVYSDSISEAIRNLSEKSDKFVNRFAKDLVKDSNYKYKIYVRDARKYVKITNKETDNGGDYYVTQFITVCNGKVFNISFFNDKGMTARESKILDTFEVKEATFPSKKPVYIVIASAVAVALLVCLVIYMLWGLIVKKKEKVTLSDTDCFETEEQGDNENIALK